MCTDDEQSTDFNVSSWGRDAEVFDIEWRMKINQSEITKKEQLLDEMIRNSR